MINEIQVRQIFEGCGFQHRLLSKPPRNKKTSPPKESSIEKIYQCVKSHSSITKKAIMEKTEMGELTARKCLNTLVARNKVSRERIGMSGPHEIHSYMAL